MRLLFSIIACIFCSCTFSQVKLDSLVGKLNPDKFIAYCSSSSEKLEKKLIDKSTKVLDRMKKNEERIYSKMLHGKDSLLAKSKLSEIQEKYSLMKSRISLNSKITSIKTYIPRLDSLTTVLKLLDQNNVGSKVKDALVRSSSLQAQFQKAEDLKKFIQERQRMLKEQLEKLGLVKQLKQFNKQVYYYSAQVNAYKEILKDPKKIEKKALDILSKTKMFQDFFKKNSLLATLFRMPGDQNDPAYLASLSGLQTRAQVNNIIQQQIRSGGPNAQQAFNQNVQAAQGQLRELQNKLLKYGSGSSDDIMPQGFKPNSQKTKSFMQRLEYGTNMQSQKSTTFFPTTSDIGLSLGYKLNDKSIIGVGASYKLGWGHGWNNIKLSSEGMGLRSYVDWKFKGNFWISGGYEMNYRTAFSNFNQLKDMNGWQQSGLIGISKAIPLKTKFFNKSKLQLLWDFLSYQQIPRTQPIIFRIGYQIK
jgi:hypothetical protein